MTAFALRTTRTVQAARAVWNSVAAAYRAVVRTAAQATTGAGSPASLATERLVAATQWPRVFHPLGVVRVVTPAEEAAMRSSTLPATKAGRPGA